ncbi:MAG: LPXTG cell wall anchor domain-containing protein, partial [Coriobacteriia bacterium]|nr:LPXTG cell wall anchor domain-containing protein [Coriobacteriia bacterium]
TGVISGTPTAATAAGSAVITVTDSEDSTSSITISYGAVSASVGTDTTQPPGKQQTDPTTAKTGDIDALLLVSIASLAMLAGSGMLYVSRRKRWQQ